MAGGGSYRLPLAPPETLGRRFQYALLSLNPNVVDLDPVAGYAEFQSVQDFVDLVRGALGRIAASLVVQAQGRRQRKCPRQVTVRGIDCCRLHGGPRFYTAGAGDPKVVGAAGFTSCPYYTAAGKQSAAWAHAAVSYADMVLDRGGPLQVKVERGDLPWLAKATLFSKVRVPGGGFEAKAGRARSRRRGGQGLDADLLGTVLLGGAVAFAGSQRIGKGREADVLEFFVVPDSVHGGYGSLRDLMLKQGVGASTAVRAARLASDYPVSLDIALAVVFAADLNNYLGPASSLQNLSQAAELEKAAALVTVTPQQRPMVRSYIPLTIVVYEAYSEVTIKTLMAVAARAAGVAARVQGLRDLVGRCVTAMYLQATSPLGDHVPGCVRDLHAAAYNVEGVDGQLASMLRTLADLLARDYVRMAGKARAAVGGSASWSPGP